MGKRDKKLKAPKVGESSASEEEYIRVQNAIEAMTSDDDEEANEDLSLKIVQKAMLRACNGNPENEGVLEVVTNLKKGEEKVKKKKKTEIEVSEDYVDGVNGKEKVQTDKAVEVSAGAVETNTVDGVKGEEKVQTDKASEISTGAVETNTVQVSDNAVLRKLLRGPRYFDPPDNSWGACYNCGEEGHTAVNCTSARRKKPCFVCGGFKHNAKQCSKGRDCFICKQQGHRAKDCPEKNSSKMCLKCGDVGHEMFSCRNEYCPDDLKEIQCYVCNRFGHLCCVDYGSPSKSQVSCYKCGGSGHTGLACTRSHGETNGTGTPNSCYKCGVGGHFARECTNSAKGGDMNGSCYKCGEEGHFARECTNSKKINHFERPTFDLDPYTNGSCYKCGGEGHFGRECTNSAKGGDTNGSCYKCGEEGHFARECTNSKKVNHIERPTFDLDPYTNGSCYKCGGEGHFARECTTSSKKAGKRNREHSTPKQRSAKKNRDHIEARSAPTDLGKARKNKSHREEFSSLVETKHRGGWITEDPDPEYYYNSTPRSNNSNRRSPSTPSDRSSKIYSSNGDYYASSSHSHSSRNTQRCNFNHSASNEMSAYYEHRYSASRFGNSTYGGTRRDYNRW